MARSDRQSARRLHQRRDGERRGMTVARQSPRLAMPAGGL